MIVSDPVAGRREVAGRLGATHLVDPSAEDVVARCRELTNGIGVDYAFDAAGAAALVHAGIQATRKGGTTVMVGAVPITQPVTIPIAALFGVQEKKLVGCILGSCNSQRDIPRMIALWRAGRLDLESADHRALPARADQRRARRAAREARRAPHRGVLAASDPATAPAFVLVCHSRALENDHVDSSCSGAACPRSSARSASCSPRRASTISTSR